MEHTYFTCDRCKATFQHKDVNNALYVIFPIVETKKADSPLDKMFGENANLIMIPMPPGFAPPVPPVPAGMPENFKEFCPDCEIEFIRWFNKDFEAKKLGVEPVEQK
jgi:hypothetical protein